MDFEPVCYSCHRVMSMHTINEYYECLKDLSERLQKLENFMRPMVKHNKND